MCSCISTMASRIFSFKASIDLFLTTNGVESQERDGQTTSALRLIMRSSNTERKTSIDTKCCQYPPLQFLWTKFVQHGSITITIDCKGLSLLIFEEKWPNYASRPKSAPKRDSFLGTSAFQCIRAGFLCPKSNYFACLHTRQAQNELHLKRWFLFLPKLASYVSRSVAIFPCSSVYKTIFVRQKDKTNYLSNQTWANVRWRSPYTIIYYFQ